MDVFFLASLLLGVFAGLSAGLFGIGGGVVIVPILAWLLPLKGIPNDLIMITAVATSLATIVFTSSSSLFAHHKRDYVLWDRAGYLSFGTVFGVIVGAFTAEHISNEHLRVLFALFLFFCAMQIFIQITPDAVKQPPKSPVIDYVVGILIGIISAISGTGGGTITVPYLIYRKINIKNAIAVSSACSVSIALSASISYAYLGKKIPDFPDESLGYIYLPAFFGITLCSIFTAPLGAKLAHILPAEKLKHYFAIVLFLLALKMLWH